jgi:hypothetical protein
VQLVIGRNRQIVMAKRCEHCIDADFAIRI